MHLSHAFFDAHTHAHRDTPMCMHLTTYSHAHTHMPMCKQLYTQTHAHTYVHESVHILSFSNTPTHTHRWAGTCVPALSWGTHTDMHAHTAMCMHLCMHSLSQTHTHMHTPMCMQLCMCSLTYTHAHPKDGHSLSWAHTRTCMLTHPCACTCQCAHEHRFTYTHVSYVWDTRGTDWP